jgi:hypothetical protein
MADKILVEHPAGNPPALVTPTYFEVLTRADRPGGPWQRVTSASLARRKKEELLDLAARIGVNVDPTASVKKIAEAIVGDTDTTAQEG